LITYRATLDVPMELLRFVTRLLIADGGSGALRPGAGVLFLPAGQPVGLAFHEYR
jgi:hypothetical protein